MRANKIKRPSPRPSPDGRGSRVTCDWPLRPNGAALYPNGVALHPIGVASPAIWRWTERYELAVKSPIRTAA